MVVIPASNSRRGAFTLIELLVVVAVICLLMAILLPSLSQAKKYAKTMKCAAQLKQIDLAMTVYATEYEGSILGNSHTSGAFLDPSLPPHTPPYGEGYCPNISQCWDWMAPAAKEMGLPFDEGALTANRQTRFRQLNKSPVFLCPENDIISTSYSGASFVVPSAPMVSYNTASIFQYECGSPETPQPYGHNNYVTFPGYRPKISMVGNASAKLFIADGARFSDGTLTPDVELNYLGSGSSPGGHYADYGPWEKNGDDGTCYTRAYAKPNGITFSMRHGSRAPNRSLAAYRFNAAFFDGHVETMDGLRGANPALWVPSGASISSGEINAEVTAYYHISGQFVAP